MRIRQAHGFALIDLLFVCGIVGILCSIAMPSMVRAKATAGSASAIGTMRAISSAQLTYALTCGSGFYAPNLTTLGKAPIGSAAPFVSGDIGAANKVVKSTYEIQVAAKPFDGAPASCNGLPAGEGGQGFKAAADPLDAANGRHFATNATNSIYEDDASLWGAIPEIGEPPSGHVLR